MMRGWPQASALLSKPEAGRRRSKDLSAALSLLIARDASIFHLHIFRNAPAEIGRPSTALILR
jgi:hypothetical protein